MLHMLRRAATAAALLLVLSPALGQQDQSTLDFPVGQHRWIGVSSDELLNQTRGPAVVFDELVRVPNAAWVRLHFGSTRLSTGSFIRITSLQDGEVQELDSKALMMWGKSSAYFNGQAVRVELVAQPKGRNAISIDTATWEPVHESRGDSCGICSSDDRVPSSDNRFCRLMPVGCSATLYNEESCLVSAGHCMTSGLVAQFNVPSSNSDCSTNQPPVADQFPVTNYDGVDAGVGSDYAALKLGTNSSGELPVERYGAFVSIGNVPSSGTLTVNGYGVDSECTRSQTQQFCDGPMLGSDSTAIYYNLDVTFGNSGSSILYNNEIVGVVTHCSYSCENYGTRIDRSGFSTMRDDVCAGGGGGGGDCPSGEIEDCNGNCCPADWVGDGYCDDGSYSYNGVPIYLNCDAFDCDGGDCVCDGDPTGGCCVGTSCSVTTQSECSTAGGTYLGDGTDCSGDPCDGGGGSDGDTCGDAISVGEGSHPFDTSSASDSGYGDPDDSQCADTYLDWLGSPDVWFVWTPEADGTATFYTCDTSSYDTSMVIYEGSNCNNLTQIACNGDYGDSSGCQDYHSQIDNLAVSAGSSYYIRIGGWQAATGAGTLTIDADLSNPSTGACCFGESCEVLSAQDCANGGGSYQGDNVSCSPNPCETPATGACCITGTCYTLEEGECDANDGEYQGDDTNCDADPCGTPATGACCVDTNCYPNLNEAQCSDVGGDYQGDGTTCANNPCDSGGGDDIAIAWNVVGVDLIEVDQPHYTVDVYLVTPDGWRLDAVAGNDDQLKTITSSTSFYQSSYGGPTTLDVNPAFYPTVPSLEWDSRVGIGAIDSSGNPYDANNLNQVGIDWTNFENGGDMTADNGVWFILPTDPAGEASSFTAQDCSERDGVWIARLTTLDLSSEMMVDALFQGRDTADDVWQEAVGGSITYQGELDCNLNRIPDACDIANGTSEDADGNGVPDECDSTCPGDADGDGDTDVDDILEIISGFNNGYDVDDLLEAIANYGCTP
ncbi:MAG: hypothetical protein MK077_07665 [Phycisphaerales bacterium]|nr:hypothetical protein [Phycisphaerales bacterium]